MKTKRNAICVICLVSTLFAFPAFANDGLSTLNDTTMKVEQIDVNSSEQVNEVFCEYYSELNHVSIKSIPIENEKLLSDVIDEDFVMGVVEYAVNNGYIDDTKEARDSMTIATYRYAFQKGADWAYSKGFTLAAELLEHSLLDNPRDLYFGPGSTNSNKVANNQTMTQIYNSVRNGCANTSASVYIDAGSATFNSTTDLHLAINKANWQVRADYDNGNHWNAYFIVTDVYNYDYWDYDNDIVTGMNNVAHAAQSAGAITPYNVQFSFNHGLYI